MQHRTPDQQIADIQFMRDLENFRLEAPTHAKWNAADSAKYLDTYNKMTPAEKNVVYSEALFAGESAARVFDAGQHATKALGITATILFSALALIAGLLGGWWLTTLDLKRKGRLLPKSPPIPRPAGG